MKNIEADSEDTIRPRYERSDFGEIIRGKFGTAQVDFHQLTAALLSCIGEDEGVRFMPHSTGNYLATNTRGNWTYEIDNANQITFRYWLSEFSNIEETISNPTGVTTPKERTELQHSLEAGVARLRTKVATQLDRQ